MGAGDETRETARGNRTADRIACKFNLGLIVPKSGGGLRPAAPLVSCVASGTDDEDSPELRLLWTM